jgi:hypothetical protein
MLLTIDNFRGDISSDMIRDIIAKNKRNSLALLQVDMADHTLSKHSGFLLLPEGHRWARFIICFAVVDCDI